MIQVKLVNKNKGFTLVELLGIIVILAIIALITVPIMRKVILGSEKGTFLQTGREIFKAGENYKTVERVKGHHLNGCVYFDFGASIEEETIIHGMKYVPISRLSLEGKAPIEGILKVCEDKIELEVGNGHLVARGDDPTTIVVEEGTIADTDKTPPIIELINLESTTSTIKVTVNAYEEQGKIEKYLYSIDGTNYTESKDNIYTFENLISNKEYTIYVKVVNKSGLETKGEETTTTKSIENPKITYTNIPTESQNGYLKEQTVNIIFSSANITNPEYYIKTTREGISSIGVTSSCGTGINPGTCTNITSTMTLSAGIWYKVSENVNITYNTESTETGTIYAITYDGTNYSTASTGSISKIDRTSPDVTLGTVVSTTNSIIIPYTMLDTESGLNGSTCKYSTVSATYNTNASIVSSESCTLNTNLNPGTIYYYQICTTDKVGNTATCKTGSAKTKLATPTITYINTPSELQNGYLKEQTAKVSFNATGISNPQYFIKTTKAGTSSIAVTESYGTGNMPGTKTTISSTTTLSTDTWYKVSGNVNVTYNTASTSTGTIYALTYDGTDYSDSATATISKIDRTSPTVNLQATVPSANGFTIPYTMSDTESGLGTPTCKYGITSGTYNMNGTATTSSCVLTGLSSGKTYYYQICVSDKVGNTATCKTGSEKVKLATPTITYTNTPSEPADGWLKEQVVNVKFNGEGVSNPQYFIKTTQIGTSSIAVTESYGTGDMPGTKTTISSRTSLSANTWYKVSGDVNITYNRARTVEGTIYALMNSGTEYSDAATGTLAKIDRTAPTLSVSVDDGSTYAKSHTATITITDSNGSGLPNTPVRIYYAWGTSSQSCSSMSKYVTITPSSGATSVSTTVTMSTSTYGYGSGNIYICNKNAAIKDKVDNSVAQSTVRSAYMYLGHKYSDGYIVYFNPNTGAKCTNYTSSQSNTGVNSGCMKWYVVKDDYGSSTVNLLLDHNISSVCNESVSTISTVINQLRSDTSSWTGVITHPTTTSSYHYYDQGSGGDVDYTIPYNNSKARLLNYGETSDELGSAIKANLTYGDNNGYWLSSADNNGSQRYINCGDSSCSYVNISGASSTKRCHYIRPVIKINKSKL